MKGAIIDVSMATGPVLDYLVAKAEGRVLRDPIPATNQDVEHLAVPFTLYEVTTSWDEHDVCTAARVSPITVTRYGIDPMVGATAPSITFNIEGGGSARGSVGMFYLDKVEAELDAQTALKGGLEDFNPCSDWNQAGPIIDREGINLETRPDPNGRYWVALLPSYRASGPTPIIAAMRCFAISKLGRAVQVPPELVKAST